MSSQKRKKTAIENTTVLLDGFDKSSIFWIGRLNAGDQCIGVIDIELLEAGVDLDELAASVFADLGITVGTISLRIVLPCGDLICVSAETAVELGPEVMDVTFTGAVPSWLTGRWVP